MKDEESDELLLSRAYWLSERAAVGQDTEATEQLVAKRSPASHSPILSQRVTLGFRLRRFHRGAPQLNASPKLKPWTPAQAQD